MNERPCPPSPYVGLVPYSEADAPFFFGRKAERNLIIENLRASRLTLLYGTSGVGKSSVLHAGVVYKLRKLTRQTVEKLGEPEFAVAIFSGWRDDPIDGLMRCIQDAVAQALNVKSLEPVPMSSNLGDMLKAWTDRFGIQLFIILDQFEEYFQYRGDEDGEGTFAFEFPRAVNRADLPVKFMISMRDDGMSRLDRFKTTLPGLFVNLLRINQMNVEAARKAIEEPIKKYNELCVPEGQTQYAIEESLVDEIIKQIIVKNKLTVIANADSPEPAPQTAAADKKSEVVETPYLQLVMTRLWEKECEENSHLLRLKTLNDLEGLQNIIQVYLTEALSRLSSEQQRIAARAFDYLVTASGTKVTYMETDLAARLKDNYGIASGELRKVLRSLLDSRILRAVEPSIERPNESRYEVFHDVLAFAILKWQEGYWASSKAEEKAIAEAAKVKEKVEAEAAKAKQERVEAEKQRIADEKKRREREEKQIADEKARNRKIAIRWLCVAILILVAALGFALIQWRQARTALKDLEKENERYHKLAENNDSLLAENRIEEAQGQQTEITFALLKILIDLRSKNQVEKDKAVNRLQKLVKSQKIPENLHPAVLQMVEEVEGSETENLKLITQQAFSQTSAPANRNKLPIRIYIQIQDESQRDGAEAIQKLLENSHLISGEQLIVPGIENTGNRKLQTTILKYFNKDEEELSNQIVNILQRLPRMNDVTAVFIPGFDKSTSIRPKHFELWFSADAFADQ